MATYRNRKELEGKTLELNDIVIFTVKGEELEYMVLRDHLWADLYVNSIIFNRLGIKNEHEFASKAYGYNTTGGSFPECHKYDYTALTRIAIALFDECEKVNRPTLADECENVNMGASSAQDEPTQDNVNHPSHYTWLKDLCGIEVIDITRHMDFDLGNAVKYILRAGHKSEHGMTDNAKTIEDLRKAVFYLNDKIDMLKKNGVHE